MAISYQLERRRLKTLSNGAADSRARSVPADSSPWYPSGSRDAPTRPLERRQCSCDGAEGNRPLSGVRGEQTQREVPRLSSRCVPK